MRVLQLAGFLLLGGLVCGTAPVRAGSLGIDRSSGKVRLWLDGDVGQDYIVQFTADSKSFSQWKSLLSLTLTNPTYLWHDPAAALLTQRFYRAIKLDGPHSAPIAGNFRLLDHLGKSRELYYYSDASAIVLAFVGPECAQREQTLRAIKSLQEQFSAQGVIFWTIDSNPQRNRDELRTEATSLEIDFPVLQDKAQLVALTYAVSSTPEVIGINPVDWTIFYRGVVDDRVGSVAQNGDVQLYLANALDSFLANSPVSPYQTQPGVCEIQFSPIGPVSYAKDIAPLLQAKCVTCHSPGNIAPWSMTDHAIVKAFSSLMREKLLTARMPPWHADPQYGVFANDRSLTSQESGKLVKWIDQGSPRGDGADPLVTSPPPPVADWPLGKPDFVVSIPKQIIPSSGVVEYKYEVVDSPLPSDAWLRAAVVRPSNRKVVHHCLVFVDDNLIFSLGGLRGFFASFLPGAAAVAFPEGTGKFLGKGSKLQFQMHYTTTGEEEVDQTELGLYLAPTKPALQLQTGSVFKTDFHIPPFAKAYEQEEMMIQPFAKDVLLYELSPHMHYRGAWFNYEARYPDGTKEILLSVPMYEFHWQTLYRFTQPKRLPAGTQIVCRGSFDNSAQNLQNPDPSKKVEFGEQSFNEMFVGYLNYAELP
jgi:hypothetical protein